MEKKDPAALYYSIMRILNIPKEEKYETIVKLDERFRMAVLHQHLRFIDYDIEKGVNRFICTPGKKIF